MHGRQVKRALCVLLLLQTAQPHIPGIIKLFNNLVINWKLLESSVIYQLIKYLSSE